jgi:hypothetical protein
MRPVILAFIAWFGVAASAAAHEAPRMAVEGTEFVVTFGDGRVMRSRDLAGTVIDVRFAGEPMRLRIAAVEPDPQDRTGTVWLHTFETPVAPMAAGATSARPARTAAGRASPWWADRMASS